MAVMAETDKFTTWPNPFWNKLVVLHADDYFFPLVACSLWQIHKKTVNIIGSFLALNNFCAFNLIMLLG